MTKKNILCGLAALFCFASLIGHFYACREILPEVTSKAIVQYMTYYTTLTGIAVGGCFVSFALHKTPKSPITAPEQMTSLAIQIFIVFLIYNGVLRPLWEPQGIQLITDICLHVLLPILFILFWYFTVPKNKLPWNQVWKGLRIPLSYLAFTFFRGYSTDYYPYPFLHAGVIGYPSALGNAFILVALAAAMQAIVIWAFRKKEVEEQPA